MENTSGKDIKEKRDRINTLFLQGKIDLEERGKLILELYEKHTAIIEDYERFCMSFEDVDIGLKFDVVEDPDEVSRSL